jgi:hypothetical protein
MTPEEFTSEMLQELRHEFMRGASDKQFFQERTTLIEAITLPARYLNDRGAVALTAKYRGILHTIMNTIRRKGNRAVVRRFSIYFLKCVQEHMHHHGEDYYNDSKSLSGRVLLQSALRDLRRTEALNATAALAEAHRALRLRGGRRKAAAPVQPELFSVSRQGGPFHES